LRKGDTKFFIHNPPRVHLLGGWVLKVPKGGYEVDSVMVSSNDGSFMVKEGVGKLLPQIRKWMAVLLGNWK